MTIVHHIKCISCAQNIPLVLVPVGVVVCIISMFTDFFVMKHPTECIIIPDGSLPPHRSFLIDSFTCMEYYSYLSKLRQETRLEIFES